tara:strand:- start:4979 stop:5278 length:300 start_codon:yes stop_codon:yes gene_type:complete
MILQIIDDKTYINGIESPIEDMPEDKIEERLIDTQKQVQQAQQIINKLHEQRDELISYAFANGFSAIRLGSIVGLTRQRIYNIVFGHKTRFKANKNEEE